MDEGGSDEAVADEEQAIRALFWASLESDGVAASILVRTAGDILFGISSESSDSGESRCN